MQSVEWSCRSRAHALSNYLTDLAKTGRTPTGLNNVHPSILPDFSNVFASFEEMERLRKERPYLYGDIHLVER